MPNGDDKNFVRLCLALTGFHQRYGRWPTRIRVFPGVLANLHGLFSEEDWVTLNSKFVLVAEDVPFVADDDHGNEYSYTRDGIPSAKKTEDLHAWLGVKPMDHRGS